MKVNAGPVSGNTYSDTRVTKDHGYEYRVIAINSAGNFKCSERGYILIFKAVENPLILRIWLSLGRCSRYACIFSILFSFLRQGSGI